MLLRDVLGCWLLLEPDLLTCVLGSNDYEMVRGRCRSVKQLPPHPCPTPVLGMTEETGAESTGSRGGIVAGRAALKWAAGPCGSISTVTGFRAPSDTVPVLSCSTSDQRWWLQCHCSDLCSQGVKKPINKYLK